mmetsp:Transcript_26242/g.47618  ORF Transcript_26242/g.47618 Transcript_26242/m.47618 type:complete len:352 (-) Transcript_26242:5-1060(-)
MIMRFCEKRVLTTSYLFLLFSLGYILLVTSFMPATSVRGPSRIIQEGRGKLAQVCWMTRSVQQQLLANETTVSSTAASSSVVIKPGFVAGPSLDTKPDYKNIHGPLGKWIDNNIFMTVFRYQLAQKVGVDSSKPLNDYTGLIELTAAMNARYSNRTTAQELAQETLLSLFPPGLPKSFSIMFAKPFPKFSARLNAWATMVAGTWLMGEGEVSDCQVDGDAEGEFTGISQGLYVKRCRFLEESGCASVCVNSCKIPTQNFFMQNMGLPLTMTPNYETGECQFSFGLTPNEAEELDAKMTPCLMRCPTGGSMRSWHNNGDRSNSPPLNSCTFMDDGNKSMEDNDESKIIDGIN